eukprot:5441715-Pleurochrysis_carterae.AAC.1
MMKLSRSPDASISADSLRATHINTLTAVDTDLGVFMGTEDTNANACFGIDTNANLSNKRPGQSGQVRFTGQ